MEVEAGRARFCSRSCHSRRIMQRRHAARPMFGEANPNWKGGVSTNHSRYKDRFRAKFPEKAIAHDAVQNALRAGRLVRPAICENGHGNRPHAHHDDYTKPLNVRWLCRPCHRIADRERAIRDQRTSSRPWRAA